MKDGNYYLEYNKNIGLGAFPIGIEMYLLSKINILSPPRIELRHFLEYPVLGRRYLDSIPRGDRIF